MSTVGCNFTCPGCIPETLTSHADAVAGALQTATPDMVVKRAKQQEYIGIVFCLNDPTVAYYSFRALAQTAKKAGLYVGCSTNGYFTGNSMALRPVRSCRTGFFPGRLSVNTLLVPHIVIFLKQNST